MDEFFDFGNTEAFLSSLDVLPESDASNNFNYGVDGTFDALNPSLDSNLDSNFDSNFDANFSNYESSDHLYGSSTQTTPEEKKIDYNLDYKEPEIKPVDTKPIKKASKVKKPKVSHNMIEKKYRTNINTKILMLRDAVPSLRIASGKTTMSVSELEGLTPASKLNKASVLTKATEYIQHLERKNEILLQQNQHLQQLIQQANMGASVSDMSHSYSNNSVYSNHSVQSNSQTGFDQYSYSPESVNSGNYAASSASSSAGASPNKYVLGGMAAVMGTGMLTGPDDFRGLGALPVWLLPSVGKVWYVIKAAVFLYCVWSLAIPQTQTKDKKKQQPTQADSILKTWFLVSAGVKLPIKAEEKKIGEIVNRVLGRGENSFQLLANDYMYLGSLEPTFEACFLTVLIGKLLSKKYPSVSKVVSMNLNLKGLLLTNLDYSGDNESLSKLNKLIKDLDGDGIFTSGTFDRIYKLMSHEPINVGGLNHIKYVEVLKESKNDIYKVLFGWRVLDILNDLSFVYLGDSLKDEDERSTEDLVKDIEVIETILGSQSSVVKQYFELFKGTILPEKSAVALANNLERKVNSALEGFKVLQNGIPLTDDEQLSDEEEDSDKEEVEEDIEDKKSLIKLLNLVEPENYIITVSALADFCKGEQRSKVLTHLKLSDKTPLTLLSFTSLYNLLDVVEDSAVLDQLVRTARLWLNDNEAIFGNVLATKLADKVVTKGIEINE